MTRPQAPIWLAASDMTAATLPAAWLIATGLRPRNLTERSQLRRETACRIIALQLGGTAEQVMIGHDIKGRPFLETPGETGLHLSLATRSGIVAVALARGPVGIDVERVDGAAALPFAALHQEEAAMLRGLPDHTRALAFAQLWAAKEAYVKALGTGFARAPESFAVTFSSADRFEVADPLRAIASGGTSTTIENGGQEILAAAMIVLD
ncbi:MAG: hypothetical protein DCF30_21830 [Hyphomicrobiales bacterium]|nr:MAG: hypothetical protein DCF30_21830 [Hyphomicrobiales bacterium]